ncbi:MAG: CapA family protein, partial [Clostridia bacterium]|nr:CapA family protein [Clostridia bacterium]
AGDTLIASEDRLRRQENSFDSVVAREGYDYPLRNFYELFSTDDVTYLNLECVLKDDSKDKLEGRLYNFRGPTAFTEILTSSSVEHVNLANNHYIDYDSAGRISTRRALTAAGITFSGYTWTWIYEKDGVKIGFGGIRETIWKQDKSVPAQEIAALRKAGCSYVIYQCHFGTEYDPNHNETQVELAHQLIDAGADMIIGTHPHVVQGIEVYNGKPIFYSLGNFVFGGNLEPTDYDGLALRVELHFYLRQCDGVQVTLLPLLTSGVQDGTTNFQPVLAEGEDKARILRRIQDDSEIAIEETLQF